MDILSDLYSSEINFSISCFWDNGFEITLGDEMNGVKTQANFRQLENGLEWLRSVAIENYPNSAFARKYR